MTNETIRRFQRAQPFEPFEIHLADGRVVAIPHPDFVYVPPINERAVVVTDAAACLSTSTCSSSCP